jgi:hypothetical protein
MSPAVSFQVGGISICETPASTHPWALMVLGQVPCMAGESGSISGRRMLPHSGSGILIAASAGARVVVPDVVAVTDDSGQREPVSEWLRSTTPDSGWMRQDSDAGRAASAPLPLRAAISPHRPSEALSEFFRIIVS